MDIFCLKFQPGEVLFFYPLPTETATPSSFFASDSLILSTLKRSLSLALLHFLPLSGSLAWSPPHSPKFPSLRYGSDSESVSLTLALSDSDDFNLLSSNRLRPSLHTRRLIPDLPISDSPSPVSFQITLFPSSGFSLAAAFHHAAMDASSFSLFIKSWAHFASSSSSSFNSNTTHLPNHLSPFFDRTVIKDPSGLDMLYLNRWIDKSMAMDHQANPRSFRFWSRSKPDSDLVRQDFDLNPEDVGKLRKKMISNTRGRFHLSTYVVVCSYVVVCIIKSKLESGSKRKAYVVLNADYRPRLDPPVPKNYFGNCMGSHLVDLEQQDEDGIEISVVAQKIGEAIKGLENGGVVGGAEERLSKWGSLEEGAVVIGVSGSHRFGLYGVDFGWGRPAKIEITSIDRSGAFSMMDSKDGHGGVQIGLVLKMHEMQLFASLFHTGLQN